jgi:hypothetical protein
MTIGDASAAATPAAKRIDPRWKAAYLVAVTVATFAVPPPFRMPAVAGLLLLQVGILLSMRMAAGEVFRLATRLKVVFLFLIACYLLLPGEKGDHVIHIPLKFPHWSLRLNLTGLATALAMCGQIVTVILASAVLRIGGSGADLAAGLRKFRCPRLLVYSVDNILALLGDVDHGRRGAGGGKRRRGGAAGPGFWAIARRLMRGDTAYLAAEIQTGIDRAAERSRLVMAAEHRADDRLVHDVTIISGIGLLLITIRFLRVLPGVPFAAGHKTMILFPLYILAAQLTWTRLGATTAGLIMGLVGLLQGDSRYGVFEVLRSVVPGLAIDLLWPVFRRLPRRIWIYAILGVVLSVCRVSTELILGLCLGARWEVYLGLSARLGMNLLAGILSGAVTYALFPAFRHLEPDRLRGPALDPIEQEPAGDCQDTRHALPDS